MGSVEVTNTNMKNTSLYLCPVILGDCEAVTCKSQDAYMHVCHVSNKRQ